jgi:hypothetical protein
MSKLSKKNLSITKIMALNPKLKALRKNHCEYFTQKGGEMDLNKEGGK